jgi:hypothetical protein|tara:strand:- start:5865 stop:6065 length:201 start_codon:yes stop_codon:yes gene_type:complete
MNIKPPRKGDETYRKYRYLIWRDDVGFLHLESFSTEELKKFSASISKEREERTSEGSAKPVDLPKK